MCSLSGAALANELATETAKMKSAASTDHNAAWYAPVGQQAYRGGSAAGNDTLGAAPTYSVNAAGLPLLTSRSDGAGLKVFIDFDGYGTDLPFSTDSDTSTFNASEQQNIYETWRDIVSYFSPLDVNVTTVQPPTGGNNPVFAWQRVSNSISGGAAYVGWLTNDSSNGWTGSDNAVNRHSGIAHEIGHQLGLSHQSEYDATGVKSDEYSDGFTLRDRPVIGIDYAENVRGWFYGRNSDSVSNLQDDLGTMSNEIKGVVGGDGYRPDDFGGTTATATNVPASGMLGGIIERSSDVDVFRFTSTGGTYQIAATPTFESAVSPKIELLDASGNIVAARDDADQRNGANNEQEFDLNLAAGTYYVRVASSGDYGEQGEYLMTAAPLPSGWTSQDVGANAIYRTGTAAFDPAANTLTQLGGGTDIWSTSDQFRFTSTTLTGDGSITARIDSLDNTDSNAKAGVMIRESTATNSATVYVGIKPSGQFDPIVRTSTGATATAIGNPAGITTGTWVRLTRAGNLFTVERSLDGVTWSTYGTTSVAMASGVQIGFATNSRATRKAAYATFSNILVTGALGAPTPTYNALSAPTSVTAAAAAGANTSVNLGWAAVSDAVGYAIDRSVDGVTYTQINAVAANVLSYTDANPFGSMRYFYRVAALAAGGTRSTPSAAASVVNKPNAPSAPPSSYAQPVIRLDGAHLLLNWSDVQGDTGYRVERSQAGGAFAVIATTPQNYNAYNDNGLVAGTAYAYRITPLTSVGDGTAGSWTINVATPLQAVTNLRVATRTTTAMALAWTDIASETGYRIDRSTDATTWSTVGDVGANTTSFTDPTSLTPLTRYYYRVRALDSGGQYGVGAVAFAATLSATALPAGWTGVDVGAVPGAGASAGAAGGTWTVIGSGADIWNQADQFQYANRAVTGDGSITARLASLDNTDYYVKAGVMFRESTAANSPYAFMHYSTGPGLQFEYRDSSGAYSGNGFQLTSDARWLQLTRVGNLFTASYSSDGTTWTVATSRTIAMNATATLGLAATSHNVDRLTLATYDNVSTVGTTIGNNAPTITSAATANPATVIGTTTQLTVGAADDGGAANLSYLWSTVSKPSGVADATFSVNNTNAASTTVATFAAAGHYTLRATVRDAQGLTVTSDVNVTVTLRAGTALFEYDKVRQDISIPLNGDVTATLDASDLVLTNTTTGAVVPTSVIQSSFDAATRIAYFKFYFTVNGALPDGQYHATIAAGSVSEPSGVALTSNVALDFFVLAGDLNRDRAVDFSDLLIVAQNYGQSGRTFSQGNVDYSSDGVVGFGDLLLISQRYGSTLPALTADALTTTRPPVARNRKDHTVSDDVLS